MPTWSRSVEERAGHKLGWRGARLYLVSLQNATQIMLYEYLVYTRCQYDRSMTHGGSNAKG